MISTPLTAFIESVQHFADNVADILKICIKKFDAEERFLTNFQGFGF